MNLQLEGWDRFWVGVVAMLLWQGVGILVAFALDSRTAARQAPLAIPTLWWPVVLVVHAWVRLRP